MSKVFDKYAKYYDMLYANKDYEKECDFIEQIFCQYSPFKPVKILDVGCGTAGHLIPLTRRGYEVVGLDLSETMIKIALEKLKRSGINARISVADIRDFALNEIFDSCICMFAVINYIIDTDDIIKSFKNIRRHLREGALLIFDFWYGLAVLNIKPSMRIKMVERKNTRIIRMVRPELHTFTHICKSNYHILVIKNDKIVDEIRETHALRYLFPQELVHYLDDAGFKLLKLCEFSRLDHLPSENTWNVAAIARRL